MFDPYHKWLGIPPARRPPHKRLIVCYSYAGRIHLKTKGHSEKTALVAP